MPTRPHSLFARLVDGFCCVVEGIGSLVFACAAVAYVLLLLVLSTAGCTVVDDTLEESSSSSSSSSAAVDEPCVGDLNCSCVDEPCAAPLFCAVAHACTHDCLVDEDCEGGLCLTGMCLVACEADEGCEAMPGATCELVLGSLVCQFGGAP